MRGWKCLVLLSSVTGTKVERIAFNTLTTCRFTGMDSFTMSPLCLKPTMIQRDKLILMHKIPQFCACSFSSVTCLPDILKILVAAEKITQETADNTLAYLKANRCVNTVCNVLQNKKGLFANIYVINVRNLPLCFADSTLRNTKRQAGRSVNQLFRLSEPPSLPPLGGQRLIWVTIPSWSCALIVSLRIFFSSCILHRSWKPVHLHFRCQKSFVRSSCLWDEKLAHIP